MSSLYPSKKKATETYTTEFDILKTSHRFLRDDEPEALKTWETQLAKKYEDTLFKEFALCDLKHYKSGNIALRWRTEDEVLAGAGESTCGNTRCVYHENAAEEEVGAGLKSPSMPKLATVELPFSYLEQGETVPRQALVKVVLCPRCLRKLMWKREKEKKGRQQDITEKLSNQAATTEEDRLKSGPSYQHSDRQRERYNRDKPGGDDKTRSRSRSPKRLR